MKPTMHLRWREWTDYSSIGTVVGVMVPVHNARLQQFWIIGADESDITLPREIGPDGEMGRWRDIPKQESK